MAERKRIEKVIEKVVGQVLEKHLPELQEALVKQVLDQTKPFLEGSGGGGGQAGDLLKAISSIQAGGTQKEILRALLDGTDGYCGRSALFVVKAGTATGWQGRAFDNNADIKDFSLDVSSTAPAQVLQNRTPVATRAADMDPKFIAQFGAPAEDQILLLPLHLKDKVAALVYADPGTNSGGQIDSSSLELLVAVTSAWLEVVSLRKQAAKENASEAGSGDKFESAAAPAPTAASSFSDPFAAHAPMHASAMPVPAAEAAEPAMAASVESAPIVSAAAAAPAPATDPFAQMSVEDADVHRKAQRFARLLMDEVKLYNQAKVAEGRKNKDLYDRLKEDIEKSRATYMKRYGSTAAASLDHFSNEVVRSLAEDDASLLGPNFRR